MKQKFDKVKDLVAKDNLEEALKLLKELLTENKHLEYLILQSARYYQLEKAIQIGIIEWEKIVIEKAKIRKALLGLIKELINEMEAEENEEQKFVFDSQGNERIFHQGSFSKSTKITYQKDYDIDLNIPIQDIRLEELILRFLTVFNKWYFSPLRIRDWGKKQNGFDELGNYSITEIKEVLIRLLQNGKVRKTISQRRNPIYKIAR